MIILWLLIIPKVELSVLLWAINLLAPVLIFTSNILMLLTFLLASRSHIIDCSIIWVFEQYKYRDSHNREHILSVIYYLNEEEKCFQNKENLFIQKQFILT